MPSKRKILFLCTGNSCRSQMAEGWCRSLKGDLLEPYSAGTSPSLLNPFAVIVMAEAGVDIRTHHSKHLKELQHVPFDWVVTVCDHARETCPVLPGKSAVHVPFDDPPHLARDAADEEQALEHYRRVRDDIKAFIQELPGNLGASS